MKRAFVFAAIVFTFGAVSTVFAQDKKVRIARLEVDGQVVTGKFKVEIVTGTKKVYKAKTDETGFFVPAEVIAENKDTFVGVVIRFRKYVLPFFTVHTSKFDVDWLVVGVDIAPYEIENIGDSDPSSIALAYYIEFDGEPGTRITVKESKANVTVRRIGN